MNSNTELFFKNGNVNNLKINELKFKSSTLKTGESELSPFLINDKNGNNLLSLKNDISIISSNLVGINNPNPSSQLDVNGDIKLTKSIIGKDNKKIINQNDEIFINPDNEFTSTNIKNNLNILDGGLVVGKSDIIPNNGDIIFENNLKDSQGKVILNADVNNLNINQSGNKLVNVKGKTNFSNAVTIGDNVETISSGELNVSKKITTKKLHLNDDDNREIKFKGNKSANIHLGKYSVLANTSDDTVIGNNLNVENNFVKVKNSDENGYMGVVLNKKKGLQVHNFKGRVNAGDSLVDPSVTISSDGQLIYSMPVLNIQSFSINNPNNEVFQYIRSHLTDKPVGSTITFTTTKYITQDTIINCLKNRDRYVRGYVIDKKDNHKTLQAFDVELS